MVEAILAAVAGLLFGVGGHYAYEKKQIADGKTKAEKEVASAQKKASEILLKAKDEALAMDNERRKEAKKIEERLLERQGSIDRKLDDLDKRSERLRTQEVEVEELKGEIRELRNKQQDKLEKISHRKIDADDRA